MAWLCQLFDKAKNNYKQLIKQIQEQFQFPLTLQMILNKV